ncbi:MAG: arginine decarboxylase, partial [Deltaproteobacteria bacterium]|nr:arginine decarboxylase [Deltaproteobacteria bacterium]
MAKSTRPQVDPLRRWSVKDALDLYCVEQWGRDYFSINDRGHLTVAHDGDAIDLKLLVDDLVTRGIQPPLLLRLTN